MSPPDDPLDRLAVLAKAAPPSRERDWLLRLLGAELSGRPRQPRRRPGKKLSAPIWQGARWL